jgi:alkanesulfonate monooxygenase SsuD/methylene tetrahydromethanopterin reductase-like flavin-dependent oxidoreductase (luciferase family)
MRFGLFCSPKADAPGFRPETGRGFFDYLEFNVEAEALGFHSSFSVEHHFSGWNQVSSTLMLLSALAMRTRTLRLGTAVIVPPWHNPVLLAEEAATLDLLSHGRLDLGIGKGYRHSEFKGFQISPDEDDARAFFAQGPVLAFRGRHRRTAAGTTPASAAVGRRRKSALDPARCRARLQSYP